MLPPVNAVSTANAPPPPRRPAVPWLGGRGQPRHRYALAMLLVVAATGVSQLLFPLGDQENLIMAYLLAAVIAAVYLGRGPALLATTTGLLAFLYFFVPHYYSFVPADVLYLPTFAIMATVAIIVSSLTSRLRTEAMATEERERRSHALYELSRDLASASTRQSVAEVVDRHGKLLFARAAGVVELVDGRFEPLSVGVATPSEENESALRQALAGGRATRCGDFLVHPLVVAGEAVGLLCIADLELQELGSFEGMQLLGSFANNVAVATHRLLVSEQVLRARQHVEEERLRNVMLSSVSHDLRTPLASITGAVTTLLDGDVHLDAGTRTDLMQSIREDADALERQVRNLLDLTRLESGSMAAKCEWNSIEEIVGCALQRVDRLLAGRAVRIGLDPSLPLVWCDAALVEQVLVNLLENASRYTPQDASIEVGAELQPRELHLHVADRGPGVPETERERVFEKFFRGTTSVPGRGAGIGLAICRAVAQLHGGTIAVTSRDGGGAAFSLRLPQPENGPSTRSIP